MFLSIIFQQSTDENIHAFPLATQCKKRIFTSKCRNDNKALIEASVFINFFVTCFLKVEDSVMCLYCHSRKYDTDRR